MALGDYYAQIFIASVVVRKLSMGAPRRNRLEYEKTSAKTAQDCVIDEKTRESMVIIGNESSQPTGSSGSVRRELAGRV